MRLFLRLILAGMFALGVAGRAAAEEVPMQIAGAETVNAERVIALIASTPDLVIIDSRKAEDFAAGAIAGAILLTDSEMTPERLARVVPQPGTPVLFYCNGVKCGRAAKAVVKAVAWGYTKVYYYALGMTEWNSLGLPCVVGERASR